MGSAGSVVVPFGSLILGSQLDSENPLSRCVHSFEVSRQILAESRVAFAWQPIAGDTFIGFELAISNTGFAAPGPMSDAWLKKENWWQMKIKNQMYACLLPHNLNWRTGFEFDFLVQEKILGDEQKMKLSGSAALATWQWICGTWIQECSMWSKFYGCSMWSKFPGSNDTHVTMKKENKCWTMLKVLFWWLLCSFPIQKLRKGKRFSGQQPLRRLKISLSFGVNLPMYFQMARSCWEWSFGERTQKCQLRMKNLRMGRWRCQ